MNIKFTRQIEAECELAVLDLTSQRTRAATTEDLKAAGYVPVQEVTGDERRQLLELATRLASGGRTGIVSEMLTQAAAMIRGILREKP